MPEECTHADAIHDVTPSALGCEECLKIGSPWVHLRLCRTCGHVGCCDDSPNRHATKHFHATRHPSIEGYDPPEGWGWCYIDEVMLDLSDRATPHNGPSPAFIETRRMPDRPGSRPAAEFGSAGVDEGIVGTANDIAMGRTSRFCRASANSRLRRFSPIGMRSRENPFK
jgi:hypothetical protein